MNIVGNICKIKDKAFFEVLDSSLNHLFTPVILVDGDKLIFAVALIEEKAEEDIDYDYEDNLVSNGIIYHNIYHVITYDPYYGEKYNFIVKNVVDKTAEYEEIVKMENEWNKKRGSREKSQKLLELSNQKQKLVNVPLIFCKNNEDIYMEYEKIEWIDVVEGIM